MTILSAIILTETDFITVNNNTEALQNSHSILPQDLSLLSKARVAYVHALMNIINIDKFVNYHVLGYVLRVPIVNSVVYSLYQMIPFPTNVKNSQNTFIIMGSDKDYLLWTSRKKYMFSLLNCKHVSVTEWPKCKHIFPLKFTILYLDCEAILMGPTITISSY
jgi:hypothetical protein